MTDATTAIVQNKTGAGKDTAPDLIYVGDKTLTENWASHTYPFDMPDDTKICVCQMADELEIPLHSALSVAVQLWFSSQDYSERQERARKAQTKHFMEGLEQRTGQITHQN